MEELEFLTDLPPKQDDWRKIQVAFIGAEHYELFTMPATAQIVNVPGGFKTRIKESIVVPAEKMMGKKCRTVTLFDIEIRFTELTFSAKHILAGVQWPQTFKEGELVGLQ